MNPLAAIALLSALILYLEILLVRWIGTEVRVFAYLQNGVLVATFLGLGLGCRLSRAPIRWLPALGMLLAVLLIARDPFGLHLGELLTQGLSGFEDSVIWMRVASSRKFAVIAVALTIVMLYLVAAAFVPLGQLLGAWMDASPRPIAAYTANILGSIAGIAVFDAVTLLQLPPWLWLVPAAMGCAILVPRSSEPRAAKASAILIALAIPFVLWTPAHPPTVWSPYQKLALSPFNPTSDDRKQGEVCGEVINVNNVGYQLMLDLDPGRLASRGFSADAIRSSHYRMPYEVVGPRPRVLIVGAGSGNDASAALLSGAESITAVEIDPQIVAWGRERHPNRPYASGKVTIQVEDARAWFHRDTARYDLIWFGLLDSHTTTSAYTNVRLDHFVYTRESFADMAALLAPGGVVVLFFEAHNEWIKDRLVGLSRETFQNPPLVFDVRSSTACLGWGGLLVIAGPETALAPIRERTEADPWIRSLRVDHEWPMTARIPTDDWPYLYLRQPRIPTYHLLVGLSCLGVAFLVRRRLFAKGEPLDVTMMLLGAAFMLLEVTAVSRAALLFGTTWKVNAYVIGAILSMVLIANLIASRIRYRPTGWPFAGLAATLIALCVVPAGYFATLPLLARIFVGGGFLALPVLFSGLIFVSLWAGKERKDLALGSNLLGSLVGGILSMASMAIGFRALIVLTLLLYVAAIVLERRRVGLIPAAS